MVTVCTEAIGEHLVITSPRSALNEAHRQPTGFTIQGGKQRGMEKSIFNVICLIYIWKLSKNLTWKSES